MALGDALKRRVEALAKRQPLIGSRIAAVQEGAALRAVEEAQSRTPPNDGDKLRGVNIISGELAQHWATDSQTVPRRIGNTYVTALANDKDYAGYVNDGHRLDKHFVPGLYIDGDGLLSRDLSRKGGLLVGVKTNYIPGKYMKEAAEEQYHAVLERELPALVKELLK